VLVGCRSWCCCLSVFVGVGAAAILHPFVVFVELVVGLLGWRWSYIRGGGVGAVVRPCLLALALLSSLMVCCQCVARVWCRYGLPIVFWLALVVQL